MASATPQSFINDLHDEVRNWYFTDAKKIELLNRANDRFSSLAPWRWLCYSEDPVTITTEQNYTWTPSEAFISIPIVLLELEGTFKVLKNVAVVPQTENSIGLPSVFSWDDSPGSGNYRLSLFPRPFLPSGSKFTIIAKKAHTVVTSGNWGNADVLDFPDQYAHIYKQFLLAFMHNATRSGLATNGMVNPQNQQVSGPEAIALMWAREIMPVAAMQYDEAGRLHQG